jgi:hypothetical protein
MDKDGFLRELGITAGEWEEDMGIVSVNHHIGVCQTWNKLEDSYCNAAENSKLICAAPKMLIAIILVAMEKWDDNKYYFEYLQSIVEKATGRSWNEIVEIWEKCQ